MTIRSDFNFFTSTIGSCYDQAGLLNWFRLTEEEVQKKVDAGSILCLLSSDNYRLYPAFQFTKQGETLPSLDKVLGGLDPAGEDAWGSAIWLNSPAEELDGFTPAEALRSDRADTVVVLAQQAGAFRLG